MSKSIQNIQSSLLMEFSKHFHEALEQMRLYEAWRAMSGGDGAVLPERSRRHFVLAAQLHRATAVNNIVLAFAKLLATDEIFMSSPLSERSSVTAALIQLYDTETENGKCQIPESVEALYEFLDKVRTVLDKRYTE